MSKQLNTPYGAEKDVQMDIWIVKAQSLPAEQLSITWFLTYSTISDQ